MTALFDAVPAELLHREIKNLGIKNILIVPDTHQKTLLTVLNADPELQVNTFATEQEAICVNAGMWMGGVDALLIIQNVGVFASLNALRGVAMDMKVPTCMLVGQYGIDVNVPIEESRVSGVRLIRNVLDSLDVPCYAIDRPDDVGVLRTAYDQSRAERGPTVVLVTAPTA